MAASLFSRPGPPRTAVRCTARRNRGLGRRGRHRLRDRAGSRGRRNRRHATIPSRRGSARSVEIEGGSGGAVTTEDLEILRDGILRGLHAYGVLARAPAPAPAPAAKPAIRVDAPEANNHAAPRDGILEHRVALGDEVATGDLLAVLHPAHGRAADPVEIRATGPGIVLRQRAKAFVRKGELICNTGTRRA